MCHFLFVLVDRRHFVGELLSAHAADDEPADLAGAGADLVELAVWQDPPRRVVVVQV